MRARFRSCFRGTPLPSVLRRRVAAEVAESLTAMIPRPAASITTKNSNSSSTEYNLKKKTTPQKDLLHDLLRRIRSLISDRSAQPHPPPSALSGGAVMASVLSVDTACWILLLFPIYPLFDRARIRYFYHPCCLFFWAVLFAPFLGGEHLLVLRFLCAQRLLLVASFYFRSRLV